MKKRFIAKLFAVLGIAVCGAYLLLLLLSQFVKLPLEVSPNFLFADWLFIAVPILGFLCAVLLQVASVRKR